jgi:hypothetical protein
VNLITWIDYPERFVHALFLTPLFGIETGRLTTFRYLVVDFIGIIGTRERWFRAPVLNLVRFESFTDKVIILQHF